MYYTLLMNTDKVLEATQRPVIYQRERNVDTLRFLFPPTYGILNLADYAFVFYYLDMGNVLHAKVLEPETELYKGYLSYVYPIDINLTRFAGKLEIWCSFCDLDGNNKQNAVLTTDSHFMEILPVKNMAPAMAEDSVDVLKKIIESLESRVEQTEIAIDEIDTEGVTALVTDADAAAATSAIGLDSNTDSTDNDNIYM